MRDLKDFFEYGVDISLEPLLCAVHSNTPIMIDVLSDFPMGVFENVYAGTVEKLLENDFKVEIDKGDNPNNVQTVIIDVSDYKVHNCYENGDFVQFELERR